MDKAQPKILRGTEGIGTVTPQMIEERAHEIARADGREEAARADGREEANDLDRTHAHEDLTGGSEKAPTNEEPDGDWYTPRGSSGEKAPTVRPEDEENIPEKLIEEGVEEADHDQRSRSGTRK